MKKLLFVPVLVLCTSLAVKAADDKQESVVASRITIMFDRLEENVVALPETLFAPETCQPLVSLLQGRSLISNY